MSDDEANAADETNGTPRMSRRRALATLGAGAGLVAGIGALPGSVAAWKRNDVEFKGCSEVWIIVAPEDLDPETYTPPTVAHVIVETADGDLDCRLQEFTTETTTTIPGQYGDAPVLKYAPPSGEKVLGAVIYNYTDAEDRFSRESPLRINPNRCANTPGTPDPRDAECASNTYVQDADILDGNNGVNGGGKSNGRRARTDDDDNDDSDDNHERGRGQGGGNGKQKGKGK